MDLSKAFDSLDHKLLLAKLSAYGLDKESLHLLKCYLSNRYQRTKVGSFYSEWLKIILGVPQGSILGPILFNIFINDLLLVIERTDICNFADDNTIYACAATMAEVKLSLEFDLSKVLKWFSCNQLAANPAKFQMMILGGLMAQKPLTIKMENIVITSSDSVRLLGITIDDKLSFTSHISTLCTRANSNVRNLCRIRRYLNQDQLILLFNSFILSIFNYAPIVWMFCNKSSCKSIDSIHKRSLRAVYGDYVTSYEDLLQISGSKRIHEIHLCQLLSEIYKTAHSLNPSFMQELFKVKESRYSLRNQNLLSLPATKTNRFGTQSFLFRGSLLWNLLPDSVKNAPSLASFKNVIKSIKLQELCTCKICK